jgi:transposase, IS30 family
MRCASSYQRSGVSMVRFSNAQVAEAIQPFWAALQRGEFISDAAVAAGTYRKQGSR